MQRGGGVRPATRIREEGSQEGVVLPSVGLGFWHVTCGRQASLRRPLVTITALLIFPAEHLILWIVP